MFFRVVLFFRIYLKRRGDVLKLDLNSTITELSLLDFFLKFEDHSLLPVRFLHGKCNLLGLDEGRCLAS